MSLKKLQRWVPIFCCWVMVSLIFSGCAQKDAHKTRIETFDSRSKVIAKNHIPDRALDVFEADISIEEGQWVLQGESTRAPARLAVLALADSLLGSGNFRNEFRLLPDTTLGDSSLALVNVSVTPLRDEPRYAAQIIDQSIMGMSLRLLRKKGGWYLCRTDYDYVGWVDGTALLRTDAAGVEAWQSGPIMYVTELYPMVRSLPDEQSEPIADLVLNARVRVDGHQGKWLKVSLPDGRKGFLAGNSAGRASYERNRERLKTAIVRTARSMMGIPYLWGGNSSKANDCSGFTQTVYRVNGIFLPRDSRQQALVGETITPAETWSNVEVGDLLFFGNTKTGRVSHVGISLGGMSFIDQGGMVKVNSLDSTAANYNVRRKRTLLTIKRVLEN